MDKHISELTALLSLKKGGKKEPNSLERKQFETSWTALVNECGFSAEAESFLYDGYTYCGAEPFYAYMKKAESRLDTLHALYRGKKYGETCVNTSSLLIHMLALALNDSCQDYQVIASLILHIPGALKNKEGKLYGQADRVFKKYLFDKLAPSAQYPSLSELREAGLKEISVREFSSILGGFVEKMDSIRFNKKCQENIHKVDLWLNPPTEPEATNTAEPDTSEVAETTDAKRSDATSDSGDAVSSGNRKDQDASDALCIDDHPQSGTTPEAVSEVDVTLETQSKTPEDESNPETEALRAEIEQLKVEQAACEQSIRESTERIEELLRVKGQKDIEIKRLSRSLTDQEATITSLRERASAREAEIRVLQEARTTACKKVDELTTELSQRDGMIEMLRRDRSHQSDEAMKRLSGKLRYLYADYVDAKALTMSEDLGENMRDQLGEVFKILIAAGIKL